MRSANHAGVFDPEPPGLLAGTGALDTACLEQFAHMQQSAEEPGESQS